MLPCCSVIKGRCDLLFDYIMPKHLPVKSCVLLVMTVVVIAVVIVTHFLRVPTVKLIDRCPWLSSPDNLFCNR